MGSLKIKNVNHLGIVLEPSIDGFDKAGATFECIYRENGKSYLFYSGSTDTKWSKACIGVAISNDGINFTKQKTPLISYGREALTPAVFQAQGSYWMVFSSSPILRGRRLMIAKSDDLLGPWEPLRELIKPEKIWEGSDIDMGTSVVPIGNNEFLLYYSNVSNHPISHIIGPNYKLRRIGILSLKITGPRRIEARKWEGNPLKNLNGQKNSWNESLFCPGYFKLDTKHYLLPSASTYSVGLPYKQYIGLIEDSTPFFTNPTSKEILIDGPQEKNKIIPDIKNEIALDTPYPIIIDDKIWIYYAVMDRHDEKWKTALSIYTITN